MGRPSSLQTTASIAHGDLPAPRPAYEASFSKSQSPEDERNRSRTDNIHSNPNRINMTFSRISESLNCSHRDGLYRLSLSSHVCWKFITCFHNNPCPLVDWRRFVIACATRRVFASCFTFSSSFSSIIAGKHCRWTTVSTNSNLAPRRRMRATWHFPPTGNPMKHGDKAMSSGCMPRLHAAFFCRMRLSPAFVASEE
jgi:hypothetical protein